MDDTQLLELTNKIISSAKITRVSQHEQELSLEFTDGTSFSFACASKMTSEILAYRGGVGEPEVIRKIDLD